MCVCSIPRAATAERNSPTSGGSGGIGISKPSDFHRERKKKKSQLDHLCCGYKLFSDFFVSDFYIFPFLVLCFTVCFFVPFQVEVSSVSLVW